MSKTILERRVLSEEFMKEFNKAAKIGKDLKIDDVIENEKKKITTLPKMISLDEIPEEVNNSPFNNL